MKIAIIGSSGFIGKDFFNHFKKDYKVFGLSRRASPTTTHKVDITKPDIKKTLSSINPEIILQCVKISKPIDYYETHHDEAIETEVKGLERIVEWVKEKNKKLIYISSDYVYPGETNNYDEDSIPKSVNFYGKIKIQAENIVKSLKNYTILRTTVVFGYDSGGNNFLMQMLNSNEPLRIPYDQISNPTDIFVLSKYVEGIIEKNISGLFVATGPETMSRIEFANLVADTFGIKKTLIKRVSTKELNQIAKRPLNNGTNSSKIRKFINYNPPSIIESLNEIKKNVKR